MGMGDRVGHRNYSISYAYVVYVWLDVDSDVRQPVTNTKIINEIQFH